MKRMVLLLALFALGSWIGAQNVAHEDCTCCAAEDQINQILSKNKSRPQQFKLDNGIMLVLQARTATDGKMIQEQCHLMTNEMAKENPKMCAHCREEAQLLKQATLEVLPSKLGAVVLVTSSDPAVVKKLHATLPKEESKEKAAENKAPTSEAKTETVAFEGKGDGIETCPVQGMPVNKNISVEYKGRKVYFCCQNCKRAFAANPEKYLKVENK